MHVYVTTVCSIRPPFINLVNLELYLFKQSPLRSQRYTSHLDITSTQTLYIAFYISIYISTATQEHV